VNHVDLHLLTFAIGQLVDDEEFAQDAALAVADEHDGVVARTRDESFKTLKIAVDGWLTDPARVVVESTEVVAANRSTAIVNFLQQVDHRLPRHVLVTHDAVDEDYY
jgi:hypothetical protein